MANRTDAVLVPDVLRDDREGSPFRVVIQRPRESGTASGLGRDQVGTKSGPGRDQVGARPGPSSEQVDARPSLPQEQLALLRRMTGEHATPELMAFTGRSNRSKFREQVLAPLLALGLVETTIPDKPTSSKQRYRLTAAGRALQAEQGAAQD